MGVFMGLSEQVVEAVGAALIGVDPRGHIVFSNSAATQIFGYSSLDLVELHISDLLPAWGSKMQGDQLLPPAGEAVLSKVDGRHRSGSSLALQVQFLPWATKADGLNYTLVMRDIAADFEVKRITQADERRMAHAVQGAKIGVFEVDVVNQTSQVSGAWCELMEIPPNEEIDPHREWLNRLHPDDLPLVNKAYLDCITGRSDRTIVDYRMRERNGTGWRWLRSDAVAGSRDENGMVARLFGVQTDITDTKIAEKDLRKSEHQFRMAMEYAPIGKALVAPDGRWLKANPALCLFLGYSEQELMAVDFQTITHPDDLEKDLDHVRRLLSGEGQTYAMEKRYLRRDGQVVWGHLNVALVRDAEDAPLHFISQIVDITDRQRLDRMRRNFIATVSHELRTPVTAIAAALDLIDPVSFHALSGKLQKLISISRQNSGRLRLLLDDILDVEKLSSDKMPINPVSSNLIDIIEQSIQATQHFADQYHVTVTLDATDKSYLCKIDPDRLQQVLINLLSNAAKFSHEGGQVKVSVASQDDQIRIAIADHGIGIPTAFHKTIFEPFSQVAPSDTRKRMGTGLGLNISKQLIERMGGEIGFTSSMTEGTEFWVILPAIV
ncbi:PAS domain S-box protein [Sedimentitalea todarodis]|uniref:histidine kinase n=1 Tax=Sedimentitalea todarodis TaxID=1631240 RepID=A0ABU3VH37_9RHOB|nr:PAS domain S-box protein [Sedimentitalea todarodis]MDU9005493.1 PAS domain S-box protein [Sedimentitalea todarodis]